LGLEVTWAVALRGPGGATIDGPSALCLPAAVLSTARRAHDLTSDALCRGAPRDLAIPRPTARPASTAASSKATASSRPGRLPSTSALSSPTRGVDTSKLASTRCGGLDPGSRKLRTIARPERLAWTRRLSSTSATSISPRAQPLDRPIPDASLETRAYTRGPARSPRSRAALEGPHGLSRAALDRREPRFHGPGAGRCYPPAPRATMRFRASRGATRRFRVA